MTAADRDPDRPMTRRNRLKRQWPLLLVLTAFVALSVPNLLLDAWYDEAYGMRQFMEPGALHILSLIHI